jgi:hypothetical protein
LKAFLAIAALGGLFAAGCGGGAADAFPAETQCAQPSPLPTSRTTPGAASAQAVTARIRGSAQALAKLRSDLRTRYPDDTFYRRDAFRPDFVAYADATICTAQSVLDVRPSADRAEAKSALDAALNALIAHTRDGREAIDKRNVSDYRKWFRGVDEKIAAVQTAADAFR